MDARLVRWARQVKARQPRGPPPLWLFTDRRRLPDPLAAIARLPRGLAGVVLRDDDHPDRAAFGRAVARLCRARRLALSVAGDPRLAASLRAGLHLRGGRRPVLRVAALTGSAHGGAELRRARQAGCALVFLSPAFATASHPGAPALGAVRWAAMARGHAGLAALGGIDGGSVRLLGRRCRAAGAIAALG